MRVLIINSCGKAKKGTFNEQSELQDLQLKRQREEYIQMYSSKSHPARDLYTGQQATKIRQAVDILRELGHDVDYYIISAGFGLLHENDEIPPYDVTFSTMRVSEIKNRARELQIQEDITKLDDGYDIIYLALGKDYFRTFKVKVLKEKGDLIVHFDRTSQYTQSPYFRINDSKLIGKDHDIPELISPIGNLVQSKGSILLNYAQFNKLIRSIAFVEWWSNVIEAIGSTASLSKRGQTVKNKEPLETNVEQSSSRDEGTLITGYDLMTAKDKTLDKIEKKIDKLSDDEIQELYEAHRKLNPRDSKRETRREWLDKYKDRERVIRKWAGYFDQQIEEIQDDTGENKTDVRSGFADSVRERQEDLGHDRYLINPVRVALLSTVVDYLDNPKKLDEGEEYTPRKSKSKKSSDLFSNLDLSITNSDGTELIGTISNTGDIPFQSIKMDFIKTDGSKLEVAEALGENFTVASGSVYIPFLRASMTNDEKNVDFKIEINGFYKFDDGLRIKLEVEDPSINDTVEKSFEFKE